MSTLAHSVKARLAALREQMRAKNIAAYFIPSADPHLSEYLPEYWQGRVWLSGFQGSAGSVLVTDDFAGLWTDSRYWVQAENDLTDTGIQLMKQGDGHTPDVLHWIRQQLAPNTIVAFDGAVMALGDFEAWQALADEGWQLQYDADLLSAIWHERPSLPVASIYEHKPPFATRARADNIAAVRQAMREQAVQWHLISSLDDIAWLLNMRGNDVPFNPVFLSHVLLSEHSLRLYIDAQKVPSDVLLVLAEEGVTLRPYESVVTDLIELPTGQCLWVDPQRVTIGTLQYTQHLDRYEATNPTQTYKALKNDAELSHVRKAMEYDGAALCEFFAWFDETVQQRAISELEVDEKLSACRAPKENFVSLSFSTIAAFAANGAMPHYQATQASHSLVQGNGLLLIDSGAQYLGGTTDITRVVPVGHISDQEKRDFTLVLKGMIALSQAVFPEGVTGPQLDILARQPLWQQGLEFGHGTGHGVGYFLNVHEGPQSIAWRRQTPSVAMQCGMITSNEPGLYRAGQWGIRIENLIAVQPHSETEFGRFLSFETLTLCPIDTRCIQVSLLDTDEKKWLNQYHSEVRERLSPLLTGAALAWLIERTQAID